MYYEIHCKGMDLTDGTRALVHEKLGLLEHLLMDYPPESVMSRVTLQRRPMTDEYYDVRAALELPGDRLYARAEGETLSMGLVAVTGELERQLKELLSRKRNESHWKRQQRSPETIRHTVPVNEDEMVEIQREVEERTERLQEEGEHRKAA